MTINEMRRYISSKYGTMSWKAKVSQMPTYQVIAVYQSFKERERKNKQKSKPTTPQYHQIDMFEYLYSINQGKETHTEINV